MRNPFARRRDCGECGADLDDRQGWWMSEVTGKPMICPDCAKRIVAHHAVMKAALDRLLDE